MKFFLAFISLFCISVLKSQNYLDSQTLNNLIDKREFTFIAERMITRNREINTLVNSQKDAALKNFMLDYGYYITVTETHLTMNLPRFGRKYETSFTRSNDGIFYTSEDLVIERKTNKMETTTFNIKTMNSPKQNIVIEIFNNGKAYVTSNTGNFTGYIVKNE